MGGKNRIVVNYGDYEGLVLLTAFNNENGVEINRNELEILNEHGWEIVKEYDGVNDFKTIKEMISDNDEGYVIKFKSGFRMKIKGAEYCRLHSIVTKISNRTVWEYLKDGHSFDNLIDHVPDEFYTWIKDQVKSFNDMFNITKSVCMTIFYTEINDTMTRKEVAEIVLSKDKRYRGILFGLYDGKNVDQMIWRLLYPDYSKPYFNLTEDES